MKVGDLVGWDFDKDVGIIVGTGGSRVQIHWSNGEVEWMWADQDGLKLIQINP
jgi:hypothetical protein